MKTTYTLNEVTINLTDAFKKRVRLFAQLVYKLSYVPTIRQLGTLLGLNLVKPRGIGADVKQYSLNWMRAFAILEDDYNQQHENQYEFAARMNAELKVLIAKYNLSGSGKLTTSTVYRFDVYSKNAKGLLVCIGYFHSDFLNKTLTISYTLNGKHQAIANVGHGCHKLLAVFQQSAIV